MMRDPSWEFARGEAVPNEVIEHFSKYEIRLDGLGRMAGEACTFLVLDPDVTILAHERVPDSHPEATNHLWAAQIHLQDSTTFRILFFWTGGFLFLLVRPSWNDFPSKHSDLIRRAREVESGSTPRPNLSSARIDFERFRAKHKEVFGPRNVVKASEDPSQVPRKEADEMRLIREYRRMATTCMEKLERIPS
jgi:hypothetical protein